MRRVLAATLMAIWPGLALAQTSTLAPVPPLPPIGLPLPEISGQLTPIGLTGGAPPIPAQKVHQPPRRRGDFRRGRVAPSSAIFFVPVYYPWPVIADAPHAKHEKTPHVREMEYEDSGTEKPIERREPEPPPPLEPEQVDAPAAPPEPPAPPSTFYYIPGCYMGNVPPSEVVLPAGCDRNKLIVRDP